MEAERDFPPARSKGVIAFCDEMRESSRDTTDAFTDAQCDDLVDLKIPHKTFIGNSQLSKWIKCNHCHRDECSHRARFALDSQMNIG